MKVRNIIIVLLCQICTMQAQDKIMMLVGTYTYGNSKGIYSCRFNQATGEAKVLDSLGMKNPSYLTVSRDGRFAYLMSELSGKVTVFNYSQGRLKTLQEITSDSVGARGGADIHLSPDGRFLYSSNRLKAEGIAIFSVDNKNRTAYPHRLSAYGCPSPTVQYHTQRTVPALLLPRQRQNPGVPS